MNERFKEHFKINGGTFKTNEDEVEAYVKKIAIAFYKFNHYSNIRMGFTEEQKNILAKVAYEKFKTNDNDKINI
jgi:hypothetical protein